MELHGQEPGVVGQFHNFHKLAGANSTEFDPKTPHPVISLLEEQHQVSRLGGTMRLGAYACRLPGGTKTQAAYRKPEVQERHRHRYEFNNAYRKAFEEHGVVISGVYGEADLVELIELKDHPWFVACQFHPEFKSQPLSPHPLFRDFVNASLTK